MTERRRGIGAAVLLAFRAAFLISTALCLTAAVLVTASLFIADRAPQSSRLLAISLAVSAAFVGAGLILFGVQRPLAAIAALLRDGHAERQPEIARHLGALAAHLSFGGAALCLVLTLITYAILARIDQGFAVFG